MDPQKPTKVDGNDITTLSYPLYIMCHFAKRLKGLPFLLYWNALHVKLQFNRNAAL